MSPPEIWGPATWTLFHTLAEHMNDESIIPELFKNIKQICMFLPCPECSQDATIMLNQIDINKIKTKQSFIDLLFVFHNMVNKKKHKRVLGNYAEIQTRYETQDLLVVFNTFLAGIGYRLNSELVYSSRVNVEPSTTKVALFIVGLLMVSIIPDGHLIITCEILVAVPIPKCAFNELMYLKPSPLLISLICLPHVP